ncbi:hypothetical protein GLOTRDRAFT_127169 [Gloeophyllum trabeum ATCC 11539]|uniref:Uncharacterized protein n=1 Tax=Gloeophyllum trabeum (strain ATCC 11539 / FP-39264 / Madison 617) TaxID=670483 RepID=S7RZ16_GLOTA|nr:uncharacterized protein GLOTRDRAFT_127169 [Gloeophyllum trabeum ATCC 11539]EPQ58679.1 hypothetical protein GLOTRDRAFT_127169 [Gloeophyllum trabeum ATCC 11539]
MEQELDEALAYLPPTSHGTLPSMEVFPVLALANAIRINLYKNVPGQRHDRCLGAAFSMASMVTLVTENNCNQVDPIVSACLTIAARLLIDLLPENSPAPCGYGYREALNVLVIALRRLGVLFPVAEGYANSLDEEWARMRFVVGPGGWFVVVMIETWGYLLDLFSMRLNWRLGEWTTVQTNSLKNPVLMALVPDDQPQHGYMLSYRVDKKLMWQGG